MRQLQTFVVVYVYKFVHKYVQDQQQDVVACGYGWGRLNVCVRMCHLDNLVPLCDGALYWASALWLSRLNTTNLWCLRCVIVKIVKLVDPIEMRKTDSFGLVLHVPSSSWAGKCYFYFYLDASLDLPWSWPCLARSLVGCPCICNVQGRER